MSVLWEAAGDWPRAEEPERQGVPEEAISDAELARRCEEHQCAKEDQRGNGRAPVAPVVEAVSTLATSCRRQILVN